MDMSCYQPTTIGGLSCYQPTLGGVALDAPPESSKKSEFSAKDLQEMFAKLNKGADPNKSLSEEDARAMRDIIDGWKVQGKVPKLPLQEFREKVFISKTESEKKRKEAMEAEEAAKEQAIENKKRMVASVFRSGPKREKYCEVCMKSGEHWSPSCPYLEYIPYPDNTTVGEKYEILCSHCRKSDHGHPAGTWPGYVRKKSGYRKKPVKEDSDYFPLLCEVCAKVVNHYSHLCPYLKDVPNPESTTVGKGYEIRCRHCNKSDHGHPDGSWEGYAWYKGWDSDVDQGRAWYKGWGSGANFMAMSDESSILIDI